MRLFMWLMFKFDLRQFRAVGRLADRQPHLDALVEAGVLVLGPAIREPLRRFAGVKVHTVPTYRVNPRLVLSTAERREWVQERRTLRERTSIAPLPSFRE